MQGTEAPVDVSVGFFTLPSTDPANATHQASEQPCLPGDGGWGCFGG